MKLNKKFVWKNVVENFDFFFQKKKKKFSNFPNKNFLQNSLDDKIFWYVSDQNKTFLKTNFRKMSSNFKAILGGYITRVGPQGF